MYQPVGATVTSCLHATGNIQVAMITKQEQDTMAGPSHRIIQEVIHAQTGLSSASSEEYMENLDNKIEDDS